MTDTERGRALWRELIDTDGSLFTYLGARLQEAEGTARRQALADAWQMVYAIRKQAPEKEWFTLDSVLDRLAGLPVAGARETPGELDAR